MIWKPRFYNYLAQHNEKPKPFRWTKTARTSSPGNAEHWTDSMKSEGNR
jgi:hypothetical protein